jgi:hypothetical protein
METPEVRMSPPGTTTLKTLDVANVSQVVRALLDEAGREVFIEDTPSQDLVPIPFDAAAAEDGLLPPSLSRAKRSGVTSRVGASISSSSVTLGRFFRGGSR